MNLSKVIICVFRDGSRLIKNRHAVRFVFRQEAYINDHWEIINQWDDPGHVAKLLIQAGYESEHLPALKLLNVL